MIPPDSETFHLQFTISENYAFVCSRGSNFPGPTPGAVYLIPLEDPSSMLKIIAPESEVVTSFGASVAVLDSNIAVGAEYADISGADYLFTVEGVFIEKVTPFDGNNNFLEFGNFVALVVGATFTASRDMIGSLYLYNATNLDFLMKIEPKDGEDGDAFDSMSR